MDEQKAVQAIDGFTHFVAGWVSGDKKQLNFLLRIRWLWFMKLSLRL